MFLPPRARTIHEKHGDNDMNVTPREADLQETPGSRPPDTMESM